MTHPIELLDSANLVDLIVFLAVAVLLGQLAAQGSRRAAAAGGARDEIADESAPPETETHIASFTDLVAAAIANQQIGARGPGAASRAAGRGGAYRRWSPKGICWRRSSTPWPPR